MTSPSATRQASVVSSWRQALVSHWRVVLMVLVPWLALSMVYVVMQEPRHSAVSVVAVVPQEPGVAVGEVVPLTASRYAVGLTAPHRLERVSEETGVSTVDLQRAVTVETTPPSGNIKITATADDPDTARDVADVVSEEAESLSSDTADVGVEKVSSAVLQDRSLLSSPMVLLAGLTVVGLALALWAAFVAERRRPLVRDEWDVERVLGVPSLAVVEAQSSTPHGVTRKAASSVKEESLRSALRAVLSTTPRSVAVVGVGSRRGAATSALVVARTLATRERVLLIDGDARSSMISTRTSDVASAPLDQAVASGQVPRIPEATHGLFVLNQPDRAEVADAESTRTVEQLPDFVDAAARSWGTVVLSSPAFSTGGEVEQSPMPGGDAILVVPRGTPEVVLQAVERRARRLHGHLRGAVLYTGPADP